MVLRGRDRGRQTGEAELVEPRQKPLLLLPPKHPKHELGRVRDAAPRHHRQDQPGEISVIEIGHAAPFAPDQLARPLVVAAVGHPVLPS